MDSPSLQLQENLHGSIRRALTSQRPVLTHLNADTSWLIQLPYPQDVARPLGRCRWNIILDPWFQGPQSDVSRFFSTQWHSIESSVQTMAELNQRLEEIETITLSHDKSPKDITPRSTHQGSRTSYIDAVVISHEFTDHCNKRTLLELDPLTPVFATKRAVELIRSWKHFGNIYETPSFSIKDPDWRRTSIRPLPSWLGISQMVSQSDALDYHSAILVAFNLYPTVSNGPSIPLTPGEAIIYTPHGIYAPDLGHLPDAYPPIRTLALLHGLHDIKISIQRLNLGAHNGLQAQRICQARYWVSTHDEVKKASGVITRWLYRKVLTLQEAIDEERKAKGTIGDESELAHVREVTFADLASGESLLLV